jgi:hypothetical protein
MDKKEELTAVKSFLENENISFIYSDFSWSEDLDKTGVDVIFKDKKFQVTAAPFDMVEVSRKIFRGKKERAESGNATGEIKDFASIKNVPCFEYGVTTNEAWEKFVLNPLKKKLGKYTGRIDTKAIKEITLLIFVFNDDATMIPPFFSNNQFVYNNKIKDLDDLEKFREVYLSEKGKNIKIN